jgi:Fe2+ transport system protein FeoA
VSKRHQSFEVLDGQCAGAELCPLSCVKTGDVVCIRELDASPEVQARLREMGLGEQQRVKLVSHKSSIICQVCNARVGISEKLAEAILVERIAPKAMAA